MSTACLLFRLFFLALVICDTSISPNGWRSQYHRTRGVLPRPCVQNVERRSADCSSRKVTSIPETLHPEISILDLSSNNLTYLYNTSFQRYSQLTDLNLRDNSIHYIENGVFYGLQHLNKLVLSGNHMNDIGLEQFDRSSELQTLDISYNRLTHFNAGSLQFLPNIKNLILTDNNLTAVNITGCSKTTGRTIKLFTNNFQRLVPETFSLEECPMDLLNVYDNPIHEIDPVAIATLSVKTLKLGGHGGGRLSHEVLKELFLGVSMSTIQELDLTYANINTIPVDLFDSLRNKTLGKLMMSYNHIRQLYPFAFSNLTRLSQLFLDGCGLRVIEPEYFYGMNELRILSLNRNQIAEVNPYKTMWKLNVHTMDLSSNALQNVYYYAFQGLDRLNVLRLLAMTTYSPRGAVVFINLPGLRTLTISRTSMRSLTLYTPFLESFIACNQDGFSMFYRATGFKNATSLVNINLGSANLVKSDIWDKYENVSLFCGLNNLVQLLLDYNQLEQIFRGLFEKLYLLKDLDLESNYIKSIEPDSFFGLTSLIKLNLRGNRLHQLHSMSNFLHNVKMLELLNIGSNGLSYVDNDVFQSLPNLTYLTLDTNRLVGFNRTTFDPLLASLQYLDISGNPFVCNCDTKWFHDWLREKLSNEVQTICSSAASTLDPMKGKPLSLFKPSDLCKVDIAMYCIASFATAAVLLICIIVYCNRWVLKYKYFLLKLAVLGYNEIQDARDQEEFDYDININVVLKDAGGEQVEFYAEPIMSEPSLYVFGGGHVSLQIVPMAALVGFNVVVIDDRPEFADTKNFPEAMSVHEYPFEGVFDRLPIDQSSYIVIVTRGHLHDRTVLTQSLKSQARYIGMIGSRRKTAIVFKKLLEEGFTQADLDRVYSPIGIDIQAETPEEIAVSIVAELIKVRAKVRADNLFVESSSK